MMCIFTTTYGESVISTPILESGEPIGPMEKGITYIVRPFMQPRYRSVMVSFSSAGSTQLFVGPAFSSSRQAINVRASTRATSLGSLRNK